MNKAYLLSILFLTFYLPSFAQFSDVRGQCLSDEEDPAPLEFADVLLLKDGDKVKGLITDETGSFIFSNLTPGQYTIEVKYIGYHTKKENFYLNTDQSKYLEIKLLSNAKVMTPADVFAKRPLDVGTGGAGTDGASVVEDPYTNPIEGLKKDPILTARNGSVRVGDSRLGTLSVIKDNVPLIGPSVPSTLNLGQVRLITSGVPAMYGDFTGGAIEITSSDVLALRSQRKVMLRSSSPFNAYHQNAFEGFAYKPLKIVDSATRLSLTSSVYFSHNADQNPASIDLFQLSEDAKSNLLDQPVTVVQGGSAIPSASQLTMDDFQTVDQRQNAASTNAYAAFTLGWKPNERTLIKVEPSFNYTRRNLYSFPNSLMNAEHNPLNTTMTGRMNAQFIQTLKAPYDKKGNFVYDTTSFFSKINYMVIADYQRVNSSTVDPIHGDNIFNYGHLGKFETRGQNAFEYRDETKTVKDQYGNDVVVDGYYEWVGYQDTAVSFQSSGHNQHRSAFTEHVFDTRDITSLSQVNAFQGLVNGQNPSSVHSMWYAPGAIVTNYNKSDYTKASLTAIINMALHPQKDFRRQHDVQFGILAEQRNRSYYSLDANSLWQLMPLLLNQQYANPDLSQAYLSYDQNGTFTDSILYDFAIDESRQSTFDKNLRAVVGDGNGYKYRNGHFIDVNSVSPEQLNINMFSADELWNNGNPYVRYAGYDHTGKLRRRGVGLNDFLNSDDRSIGGYNPIYTALWLQDKFVVKDIKLRAGVRIERFDANQQVLKDPFSLYPVRTAGEVADLRGQAVNHPSNLSSDAVVYVDDMNSPSQMVGYREGSTWYDEQGIAVSSAEQIRNATSSGVIQPLLVDPNNQQLTSASFQDFSPEILVLPRLSFSFPIKKDALFYAYYDVFAQRPNFAQSFAPVSNYYYLENGNNSFLPNPALKPSRRTDYKVGFKQAIGRYALLNLVVGYAEIKNEINLVQVEQAYPRAYSTYANLDFSTVKSFKVEYDLQKKGFGIKTAYLLQFADGTGSNVNSSAALIQANQPNLRSLYPLSYDIRHKLNTQMSISLDPLATGGISCALSNSSLQLFVLNQSGTPYTAYLNPISEAQNLGSASRSQIKGNPFGSRLVGNTIIDMSFVKNMVVGGKQVALQLNATNLLNLRTVYGVYAYSSLPDDDGFLTSPQGQQQINTELSAQSFIDNYSIKQNNPGNFGNPRMLSLTIRSTF